jgi:hypothetical protein
MVVVQSVEKLSQINFQHESASQIHRMFPRCVDRLMRRAARSKTVRTIVKILLEDRLQQHEHGLLQNLVLERWNANRTRFVAIAFRNPHATHWRRPIRSRPDLIQQRLQIGLEIDLVVGSRLAVDSRRTVFTVATIRFEQPLDIDQVSLEHVNILIPNN